MGTFMAQVSYMGIPHCHKFCENFQILGFVLVAIAYLINLAEMIEE